MITAPGLDAAIAASRLRALPRATLERVFEGASTMVVPAGVVPSPQGEAGAVPGLLVSGLLRAFHTTVDGRQVTVRYARPGSLTAIATMYKRKSGPIGQQALTACRLVRFNPEVLQRIAARDAAVANVLAEEMADRLFEYADELAGNTFGTMRQRLVRHLLDLAAREPAGPSLAARVSQQALADSVGSVREVVVRVLRELRQEGLIKTGRDSIELLQPERLLSETLPRDG
jgi:CRP/FNR family transcriptional regulator